MGNSLMAIELSDIMILGLVFTTIFSAIMNLVMVALMFAKLADTIGRILEKTVVQREVENG